MLFYIHQKGTKQTQMAVLITIYLNMVRPFLDKRTISIPKEGQAGGHAAFFFEPRGTEASLTPTLQTQFSENASFMN